MNSSVQELEKTIHRLTAEEQLWLIERLVHRLRNKAAETEMEAGLAAMAADPDIQREIREINEEFAATCRGL